MRRFAQVEGYLYRNPDYGQPELHRTSGVVSAEKDRSFLPTPRASSLHVQQLDLEEQGGIGGNGPLEPVAP